MTVGRNTSLITRGAAGGPQSDTFSPEGLVRDALHGQTDTMEGRSGYAMDLAFIFYTFYKGALEVSVVAKGRLWKTTGRQPEPGKAPCCYKRKLKWAPGPR